jgi:hypothetical protein
VPPPRRIAHKIAHAKCPWGKTSWAECDSCEARRYGRCRWLVGKKEPEQCSHWATGPEGTCGQHYAFERDRAIKAERIAIEREAMNARADAYIEWTRTHPSIFDRMVPRKRKGPYRII